MVTLDIPTLDIEDLDETLNNFLSKKNVLVYIPGFNFIYGHKHHVQLERYMHKYHEYIGTEVVHFSEEENKQKIKYIIDCYPDTWVNDNMGDMEGNLNSEHYLSDYFDSRSEVIKIFKTKFYKPV